METSKRRKGYWENQNGGDQIVCYRYINFYYFVMKMSFWPFVMCQVDTSESLEDIFPGGLINRARGKNFVKTGA